jgi:hypothetical protein
MTDLFPVGMTAVEMHGMSVITFAYLSFYSIGIVIMCVYFMKELGNMQKQIDDMGNDHVDIAKQLNDTNTKMLVAVATLTEKVGNLEKFLRDR